MKKPVRSRVNSLSLPQVQNPRSRHSEISGSTAFSSPPFPFPETVPIYACHFKGSFHIGMNPGAYFAYPTSGDNTIAI
jgi:hypothetical protein